MAKFFDKNKLSKEQKDRWDWSVLTYREIRKKNTINFFEKMDKKELVNLIGELTSVKDFNGSLTLDIVDEKSALFNRLLNGKQPLIYPPPCAYSYPWYEVIEENGPFNLSLEAKDLEEIMWENLDGESQVLIEQTIWKLLEKTSEKEMIVTFGKWEDLGFKWRLKKVKSSCETTQSFIYCHYKNGIGRITTYEELKNEQIYQVRKELDKIKLISDENFKNKYKSDLYEKYGATVVSESIFLSDLKFAEELLEERRLSGKTDYPTEEEIELMVNKKIKDYFDSGYSVDEDGKLYVEVWVLEKISGSVTPDIYIKV